MELAKEIVFGGADEEPEEWGPGVRTETIIHYVTHGKGFVAYEDKTYTVSAGESFIIRPYRQVNYGPDPEDPWGYAWVIIDSSSVSAMMERLIYKEDDIVLGYVDPKLIFPYYSNLVAAGNYADAAMTRYGLAHTIVGVYLDTYPQRRRTAAEVLYARAVLAVERGFHHRGFMVKNVADELSISPATLYRLFETRSGMSPNEYLQHYRVQQACKMLQAGLSIKETAFSCGFADQYYFSKSFRRITGVTPSEFRRHRNE